MIEYDRRKPLIFTHIPKTAGTSVRAVFEGWFGDNLRHHYGQPPERHDVEALHSPEHPLVLYGHFNGGRNLAAWEHYPQIDQFVTILRDPWERHLSLYFFAKRRQSWKNYSHFKSIGTLEEFLQGEGTNFHNFFPEPLTRENFRDVIESRFVEIGIVEQLQASLARIGDRLGVPFDPGQVPHVNAEPRAEEIPTWLKDRFRGIHALEYEVYDYVRETYERG